MQKGYTTNFANHIGLVDSETGSFVSNGGKVVLNFPFKDAVLVAGATKEDRRGGGALFAF